MACGCAGIALIFSGFPVYGAMMVYLGAIFDFFDGFVARALKVDSEMGKQLDSMSDLVTFGVLPSVLLVYLLGVVDFVERDYLPFTLADGSIPMATISWYLILPFFVVVLGAGYRLAKFNIDTRQSTSFLGLPSPANGIFFASLFLGLSTNGFPLWLSHLILTPITLYALAIIFALLMVSEIPMFAMKVKGYGWKGNEFRYALLILSLPLIIFFQFAGLSLSIILYILLSITQNLVKR